MSSGAISPELLAQCETSFTSDPKNILARNAISRTDVLDVLADSAVVAQHNHIYSHHAKTDGKATNQKSTGRCWMFAALNVMRREVIEKFGLGEDFELSQNFPFFWDKFEKSNYFLENVISTADKDVDDRLVAFLFATPTQDGGQYAMWQNIVEKYGAVPQSAMPETFSSSSSRRLNLFLNSKLREMGCRLRELKAAAADDAEFKQKAAVAKEGMLVEVYRILAVHLGQPPAKFNWMYKTKDKKMDSVQDATPVAFAKEAVGLNVAEMVSLVHDPRNPYNALYTVDRLGNVAGVDNLRYVNLEVDQIKEAAKKVILSGKAVWFGCEVGKDFFRKPGILDTEVFKYELLYGTKPGMTKKERLLYGDSLMTHAMTFTAVDLPDKHGLPAKWRVENSWGEDSGDKGYLTMSDAWFTEHVYQVVVPKSSLPEDVVAILGGSPTVLPAWDPMGALAHACE